MIRHVEAHRSLGVVVGKFNPPHLGHLHLITTAAAQVDRVVVLLCDRADQTISAETRRRWLLDACPANVEVIITPDDLPEANEPWAARAIDVLGRQPHVAFTSEPWGPGWAAAMGAQHVMVDLERTAQPTSGTALRADLGANFEWLVPAARAELARRVVVVGAESTGKSTLAAALAESLGTVWVPEYGRFYWEGRRHLAVQDWTADEFVRIAAGQHRLAVRSRSQGRRRGGRARHRRVGHRGVERALPRSSVEGGGAHRRCQPPRSLPGVRARLRVGAGRHPRVA